MNSNNCDIIIAGSGFAGLSAAIEAAEGGASVVVLEKMKAAGGNSVISDGGMAVAGSELQKKHGVEDSPELFYQDMMTAGLGLNHPALVKKLTDQSAEAYRWLVEDIKVDFMDRVDLFGGHSVPRSHGAVKVTGASIINPMKKKLESLGVSIRYGHNLKRLILKDGRVTGAVVSQDYSYKTGEGSSEYELQASQGVILAGGGYGADVPFRSAQDPRLDESIGTTNKPFAKADLIKEALRIGAAPVQLSHIQLGPWASPDESGFGDGPLFADYTGFIYGIIVDPESGERFINEQADRKVVSDAILGKGKPCLCISDSAAVNYTGWDIGKALRKGVVKTFHTLEALCAEYGVPQDPLQASIDDFNQLVQGKKKDGYGRILPRDAMNLGTAPYYAMRLWPKVHFTMGGLHIDKEARVLDLNGQVIPGLFAAGEITGGVHGASRLGSCAVTSCVVFGRTAGKQALNGTN
ncbi:MAG: flavocytochrome c [Spirochaetales bacterium]|nr:flavocytochrome c [Spirochaetales bacterium]